MKKLRITLVKSLIGRPERQRSTIRALGLGKVNSQVVHEDTPSIRGMVCKVRHLLRVEELVDVQGGVAVAVARVKASSRGHTAEAPCGQGHR